MKGTCVTGGVGGSARVISLKPLNAGELAKRFYSKTNLCPGEDYDELLRNIRNNETFVHSEAYDGLRVASNGEA
eukprot:6897382-Pyramimonas_sp.AAC.1